jgi:HD domain
MAVADETLRALAAGVGRSSGIAVDPRDLARLSVPDSPPCRTAERVCREASGTSLAAHCFRSYAWAALLGTVDGLVWDAELLYTAAMMHDLGLTPSFDRGGCFESDGAAVAREILSDVGWTKEQLDIVGDAIYLHMHDVTVEHTAEARLLALGTAADVTGRRILEISEDERTFVLGMFPRAGFKAEILALFEDQGRRKPSCVVHEYLGGGLAERIRAAPFDD